uniref:SCP domain-containing protein n=1 Tax=Steinernema glaseri TaxID=37863 RepID=A0A1I7ZQ80_9BILA
MPKDSAKGWPWRDSEDPLTFRSIILRRWNVREKFSLKHCAEKVNSLYANAQALWGSSTLGIGTISMITAQGYGQSGQWFTIRSRQINSSSSEKYLGQPNEIYCP